MCGRKVAANVRKREGRRELTSSKSICIGEKEGRKQVGLCRASVVLHRAGKGTCWAELFATGLLFPMPWAESSHFRNYVCPTGCRLSSTALESCRACSTG